MSLSPRVPHTGFGTPGSGPQRLYSHGAYPTTAVVSPRGEQTPLASINIAASSVYKIANGKQELPATQFSVVRQSSARIRQVSPVRGAVVREVSVLPPANYDGVIREMQSQISGLQATLRMEVCKREQIEWNNSASLAATKKDLQLQIDVMQRSQTELIAEVKSLAGRLEREKQEREALEVKHGDLQTEVENLKAHLTELDFFATNELQKALHLIEMRGNVQVNFDTGDVRLLRPISFQPRTTKDTPIATFTQPEITNSICQDLAELMKLFDCPIEVEGHTKGGEGEFWQTLANERARVVVDKMVEFGADASKITSRGRPGNLGLNETRTIIHLNLPADSREQAMRKSKGLISLG